MASKNVNATQLASWYIGTSEWRETSSEGAVWVWSRAGNGTTGYRAGRAAFSGLSIGAGTLTSAYIHLKTSTFVDYSPYTLRIAVSSNANAFTTDITSDYYTTTSARYAQNTEYAFPVTSLINALANKDATFYVFIIISLPDGSDITFKYLSDFQAYLAIAYTPADSVLTLGTSGGNKQCDLYIGVGGSAKKITDIYIGTTGGNKRILSS